MRDLSNLAADSMWVTSQEGGNLVHDNAPAMTAPGSEPATPTPKMEAQSDPSVDLGAKIPVGTARPRRATTTFNPATKTWKTVVSDG